MHKGTSCKESFSTDNVFMRKSSIITEVVTKERCVTTNFMEAGHLKASQVPKKDFSDTEFLFSE